MLYIINTNIKFINFIIAIIFSKNRLTTVIFAKS